MAQPISMLKKVRLGLEIFDPKETAPQAGSPTELSFIYGAASDGLSPFEVELNEKKEGDLFSISLPSAGGRKYFCHLYFLILEAVGLMALPDPLHLKISVTSVDTPENREVVRFIAQSVSHEGGCGGDCGCGCGSGQMDNF